MTLADVLQRADGVRRSGDGYVARCPAHEDRRPSLSVRQGRDGRVLVNCKAGCSVEAVTSGWGLSVRDLFAADPARERRTGPGVAPRRVLREHVYTDDAGEPLYKVVRFETLPGDDQPKCMPYLWDGRGGWATTPGMGSAPRVLYKLPEFVEAAALGRTVYLPEGERDVDSVCALGFAATTNPFGGKSWQPEYTNEFRDLDVVLLEDNDETGRKRTAALTAALGPVVRSLRVIRFPDLPAGGDVTDWLAAGGTADALLALADAAPVIAGTASRTAPPPDSEALAPAPAVARAPRFQLLDVHELEAMPEPVWLVDRAIPDRATVALVGPTKQFKSFIALDLAARISLGIDWHGRRTRPGPVVFIAGEGAAGLRKRLAAWSTFHGATPDVLVLPHSLDFGAPSDVAQFLGAIAERIPDNRVALVIVDTLNRCMLGDENLSDYVSRFMAASDAIRDATGASLLVIHHAGHTANGEVGKMRGRGSSAFAAAMDAVFLCAQVNGGDRAELVCDKQKDDVDGWKVEYEVVPVLHSLVLKPSGVTASKLTGQRLHALLVLHRDFTTEGALNSEWHEASEIEAGSSFDKTRKWLLDNDYARRRGKRYVVSDGGRMALSAHGHSTHSTATPPVLHSAPSSPTPLGGGSLDPPEVEWEDRGRVDDAGDRTA